MPKTLSTGVRERVTPHTYMTPRQAELLTKRLIIWSKDENARQIKQFLIKENISLKKFKNICKQYPDLEEERSIAYMRLADRQQEAVWKDPHNAHIYVFKFIHMVDEDYHAVNMALKNISPEIKDAATEIIGSLLMDQLTGRYVANNSK